MEVEVGQRERHQEVLRREWNLRVTNLKYDVLALVGIDPGWRELLQGCARVRHRLLEAGIVERRQGPRRREQTGLYAADRTDRVMHSGQHLESEGQHVGIQARLYDRVGIDLVFLEVGKPAAQESLHAAQHLKVGRYAEVVE